MDPRERRWRDDNRAALTGSLHVVASLASSSTSRVSRSIARRLPQVGIAYILPLGDPRDQVVALAFMNSAVGLWLVLRLTLSGPISLLIAPPSSAQIPGAQIARSTNYLQTGRLTPRPL